MTTSTTYGPHGTLTINATGQTLTGHAQDSTAAPDHYLKFRIDGADTVLTFISLRKSQVTFVPDGPTLPTEPGVYTIAYAKSAEAAVNYRLFRLYSDGEWEAVGDNGPSAPADVKAFLLDHRSWHPLVRLVPETV